MTLKFPELFKLAKKNSLEKISKPATQNPFWSTQHTPQIEGSSALFVETISKI